MEDIDVIETTERYDVPNKPTSKDDLWLAVTAYVRAKAEQERASEKLRIATETVSEMLPDGKRMLVKIQCEHYLIESQHNLFSISRVELI